MSLLPPTSRKDLTMRCNIASRFYIPVLGTSHPLKTERTERPSWMRPKSSGGLNRFFTAKASMCSVQD